VREGGARGDNGLGPGPRWAAGATCRRLLLTMQLCTHEGALALRRYYTDRQLAWNVVKGIAMEYVLLVALYSLRRNKRRSRSKNDVL
jgi:hypothetical protein